MRMRCGILFVCLVAAWATPRSSLAQPVVLSSGGQGGYYHAVADRLQAVLIADLGTSIDVQQSGGSLENLSLLDDPKSPVNLGFAQADALKRYVEDHPAFATEYRVLADIGKECVFIIASRNGDIATASALKMEGKRTLSVGDESSGAAITFEYMGRIDPSFRNIQAVNVAPMQTLLQIRNPAHSNTQALMLVQRPRTVSPPVDVVLDNLDTYRIVPLGRQDVGNAALPGGQPVYSFETVRVGFGKDHSASFDTICTRGLLLAAKAKVQTSSLEKIAKVLLESGSYIMPGAD